MASPGCNQTLHKAIAMVHRLALNVLWATSTTEGCVCNLYLYLSVNNHSMMASIMVYDILRYKRGVAGGADAQYRWLGF